MVIILDRTFFKLMSSDFKNVIACCVKCQPINVNIKGSQYSSSYFKSYLKKIYDSSVIDEYKNYIFDAQNLKKLKIEVFNNKNCKNKNKMKYLQNQFVEDTS